MQEASDLPPGTVLGAYRIERRLREGGMGVVYVAEHVSLSRMVALKVLAPGVAEDGEFRTRFQRESKLAASLEHPHIVPVYDAGEANGLLYIAMRLVEGKDLGEVLGEEGPLDPGRALSVLEQAADALDGAHAAGLVHRDVKPGNILLAPSRRGPEEHVFLTDFGLARTAVGSRLTRSGDYVGTIHYSSPEQFSGSAVDGRADVYSLGCVAFECLTGRVPFERDHEPAVMYAHLREEPPRVTGLRPELPPAVDEVIATALAKDPEARFARCGEMVEALRVALDGRAATGTPAGPSSRPTTPRAGVAAGATQGPTPGPATTPPRSGAVTEVVTPPLAQPVPRRRSRWPWIVAASVLAAGLVGGGAWLLAAGEEEAPGGAMPASPPVTPPSSPAPLPSLSPTPDVDDGPFEGTTNQGREISFSVNRSVITKLHIIVNQDNCTGTNGFPLVSQEFETKNVGGEIDPDGRFSVRLGGPDAVSVFEGRLTDPRSAEGTVSVRTTGGVVHTCTTGDVPWSASFQD